MESLPSSIASGSTSCSTRALIPSSTPSSTLSECDDTFDGFSRNPISDVSFMSTSSSSSSLLPDPQQQQKKLPAVLEFHGHGVRDGIAKQSDEKLTGRRRKNSSINSFTSRRRSFSRSSSSAMESSSKETEKTGPCKGCHCFKCASRLTVDCAAVCCCPVALLHLAALAFIRLPTSMAWKMMMKVKTKLHRHHCKDNIDEATTVNGSSARLPDGMPASPEPGSHAVRFNSQNLLEHFGAENLGFGGDYSLSSSSATCRNADSDVSVSKTSKSDAYDCSARNSDASVTLAKTSSSSSLHGLRLRKSDTSVTSPKTSSPHGLKLRNSDASMTSPKTSSDNSLRTIKSDMSVTSPKKKALSPDALRQIKSDALITSPQTSSDHDLRIRKSDTFTMSANSTSTHPVRV